MLCIWLKEPLEGKKIESIKKSKNQIKVVKSKKKAERVR